MISIPLLLVLNLIPHQITDLPELRHHPSRSFDSTLLTATRERPNPPPRLPPNRVRPGGGLNNARTSCGEGSQPLTALIPDQNPVLTTSAYPTFLFYVPDSAATVRLGKFSVFTQDEKTHVYETQFTLPQSPGIVSIRVPEVPDHALQEGQSYHWYLTLYCQDSSDSQADLTESDLSIDGWIQRVALTPDRQRLIELTTPDIWYDAVANLAQRIQSNPQETGLQERWTDLLRSIGMENLAAQPFVGSVTDVDRSP